MDVELIGDWQRKFSTDLMRRDVNDLLSDITRLGGQRLLLLERIRGVITLVRCANTIQLAFLSCLRQGHFVLKMEDSRMQREITRAAVVERTAHMMQVHFILLLLCAAS